MTSTLSTPVAVPGGIDPRTTRLGAAAGLASVVLIAGGFSLLASADATFHSPDSAVRTTPRPTWPGRWPVA